MSRVPRAAILAACVLIYADEFLIKTGNPLAILYQDIKVEFCLDYRGAAVVVSKRPWEEVELKRRDLGPWKEEVRFGLTVAPRHDATGP